jgi:hypothetical protein
MASAYVARSLVMSVEPTYNFFLVLYTSLPQEKLANAAPRAGFLTSARSVSTGLNNGLVGDLTGAPSGGLGRIGKRAKRDSRERRDESENRQYALCAVTCRASRARLSSPRADDPLNTIVAPTEIEVRVILGQCFRQVFPM